MKLCIVTWLGTGNFGTSLQSYALHKKLQEMGHDVSFLHCFAFRDLTLCGRLYGWLKNIKWLLSKLLHGEYCSKKQRKLRKFNKENYVHKVIKSHKQYQQLLRETEVFITGSDQIWNCYNYFNPFYFLDFAGNSKRVAYASSLGTNDFPPVYQSAVKELLSKFSHIGVRECTAVSVVGKLLGRNDVVQVVDPTFLLSSGQWLDFAASAEIEMDLPPQFILCYFVGNDCAYSRQVKEVQQQLGINNVVLIPALENKHIHIESAKVYDAAGPKEFVRLLSCATYVCTDSFHAMALSINMQKNFIAFKRFKDTDKESQNSRVYDLLERYGLMGRIYGNQNNESYKPVDYQQVKRIVEKDCEQGLLYLKHAVEQ